MSDNHNDSPLMLIVGGLCIAFWVVFLVVFL